MTERENPKHIQQLKEGKTPFEYIPFRQLKDVAKALQHGANKYGVRNWRVDRIKASTYVGAITRHALEEWAAGEDSVADSGLHPLAHVIACCLVVMDAEAHGTLIDDRTYCESKAPPVMPDHRRLGDTVEIHGAQIPAEVNWGHHR